MKTQKNKKGQKKSLDTSAKITLVIGAIQIILMLIQILIVFK
ncbi:hypothetical protein [Fusobacterium massiliense]|nr:hypothetical protein [Fusobacterium massiliense]